MRLSRTVTKFRRIGIGKFLGSSKSIATVFLHVFIESLIGLDALLVSKLLLKKFWATWFLRGC